MNIELEKLQFKSEPLFSSYRISIYTTKGIYHPKESRGYKCGIAELPCSNLSNPESTAYQIARLFKAAPALLEACKDALKKLEWPIYTKDEIKTMEPCRDRLKAAIAAAEKE